MAKVGDIVRFLNSTGGGRIVRIADGIAYVDEDGFETPVMLRECVVVGDGTIPEETPSPPSAAAPKHSISPTVAPASAPTPKIVIEETPGGDKLNVVLAFEAQNLKRLSDTAYDAYLVNDSNYYLTFIFLSRRAADSEWTLRRTGTIEPGFQLLLEEIAREDVIDLDRIALQLVAFKQDKPFEMKAPVAVEHKVDTTKFFKLHCFKPDPYFDCPVLAFPIVTDDRPYRAVDPAAALSTLDSNEVKSKIRADRQTRRPVQKKKVKDEPLVVDLHIAELVDSVAGLSAADMLNLQVDTFCRVMDENLRNHGRKIVFIHGKGDGMLRKAILKELGYRYKTARWQDASFREYGFGATQVTIP